MIRPIIKWAGGKTRVLPDLLPHLPDADCLIEPFVGGASVFLNTNYRRYVLADINTDLINLYRVATRRTDGLILYARVLFADGNNATAYAENRTRFNSLAPDASIEKAALFLYLNRHGFNGVCRYNTAGAFNVPFGKYSQPYFPEAEIKLFAEKARDTHAIFISASFKHTLSLFAERGTAIYCDPPYLPASDTANFTQYHTGGFTDADHQALADALLDANRQHGIQCVISNSDTPATREIYRHFGLHEISVQRSAGADAITRAVAKEVIGVLPVCDSCGRHGGGCCPDCGPAMGDATYQEMVASGALNAEPF
ncbi:DNA adenine methylase [Dickeya dianthicola]|uniref:DNA adenine methylase n=1 Tax=Dickeya dianthicola TaxID=204039 RepID=UPI001F60DBE1|nr:Dam family site-specific DNA-(adenine-N6)-methyltransferase [Dickeya dianthicola]MCI4204272.1 Dam family site-specific DNA-(adenine-N6)-methyltransferase [Dickeya dianthicola]MCI4210868.1 Dam family site-specific DNA-(adenine-N6)-methyltransferase [Dickeya dianthicola]MCI4217783.1 Dam family site-specific DNA-(adenine-N6)-methyltransferase [Dickeya dianthicola]MCI4226187.1 Dam family site-specific DNA-(adenine-N6)-methyltransferase [Dickeya dianthicola]